MAPTTDRDDEESRNESSKPGNPFIKFRQFADSQISSLLQGIVGLPSAFSKIPNTARWADFDEDIRQRDELQKKQNDLRNSEARKNEGHWPSWGKAETDDEEMDDRTTWDIPLYSPVSSSLFSHLRCAMNDERLQHDWKSWDERLGIAFQPSIYSSLKRLANPTKSFQTAVYHDLQSGPVFRSDYSLLPYMLFSPYSPAFLGLHRRGGDYLNYDAAFVDLMLATQNRPMSSMPLQCPAMLPVELERNLLYSMWAHGVLQQKSMTMHPSVVSFENMLKGDLFSQLKKLDTNEKITPWNSDTELDAYERFLHRASSSIGAAEVVESLYNEAHDWIKERLESLDAPEMKRRIEEATRVLGQGTGDHVEDDQRAKKMKEYRSVLEAAELRETPEKGRCVTESLSERMIANELEEAERKAGSGKVVSSSTSTDRTVNEDGSVETSVTVWKEYAIGGKVEATCTKTEHTTREDGSVETKIEVWKQYADGRTTITSSSHTEEHPHDWQEKSHFHREDEQPDEKKDEKRKGWFWN